MASGAASFKWTPKTKPSKTTGTLGMLLTETPSVALSGELTAGPFSPLTLSGKTSRPSRAARRAGRRPSRRAPSPARPSRSNNTRHPPRLRLSVQGPLVKRGSGFVCRCLRARGRSCLSRPATAPGGGSVTWRLWPVVPAGGSVAAAHGPRHRGACLRWAHSRLRFSPIRGRLSASQRGNYIVLPRTMCRRASGHSC